MKAMMYMALVFVITGYILAIVYIINKIRGRNGKQ
jgi:hypothetical protein